MAGRPYAAAVADHRPRVFAGDEREVLVDLLQFQRDSVVRKVQGVSEEDARRSPVPSGTSLLWLVVHLGFAEQISVLHRFAGEIERPDDHVPPDMTVADAVAGYRDTWRRVDEVVARSSLDDPLGSADDPDADLRWVLAHLLEETARHAGHADILRELLDGQTGR